MKRISKILLSVMIVMIICLTGSVSAQAANTSYTSVVTGSSYKPKIQTKSYRIKGNKFSEKKVTIQAKCKSGGLIYGEKKYQKSFKSS